MDPVEVPVFPSVSVEKVVEPRIDLGLLLLKDLQPLEGIDGSISAQKGKPTEEELLTVTRDNAQYLFNRIWTLETFRVEDAICVKLPASTTRLPREKPLPALRQKTKWEQYAQDKGIVKRKKDKLVWDAETKEWKPRFGYRRGKDDTKAWMIEIPDHKDPYADHFGERKQARRERVDKNEFQRLRNLGRQKGGNARQGQGGQQGGLGNANNTPLGIVGMDNQQRTTTELSTQIDRARVSTASVGKFQPGLPKEKPPRDKGKKRMFAPNEQSVKAETAHQLDILSKLGAKKPKLNAERMFASQQGQEASVSSSDGGTSAGDRKGAKDRPRQKSAIHRQQHYQTAQKRGRGGRGGRGGGGGREDGGGGRGRASFGGSSSRGRGGGGRGGGGRGRGRGGGGKR